MPEPGAPTHTSVAVPRLRVLCGPSIDDLRTISDLVNTNQSCKLSSDRFEGEVAVNIHRFLDSSGQVKETEYFSRKDRHGITWSLQIRGRFLQPYSADDILFGNVFERPLTIPRGSSIVFKFMRFIDPTLEHDLGSQTKPWALSPLISTMPHLRHTRVANESKEPFGHDLDSNKHPAPFTVFPPPQSISDDTSQLYLTAKSWNSLDVSRSSTVPSTVHSRSSSPLPSISTPSPLLAPPSFADGSAGLGSRDSSESEDSHNAEWTSPERSWSPTATPPQTSLPRLKDARQRRAYFSKREHREAVIFGPEDIILMDFCYGFLEFNPSLSLRVPGGWTFDLLKYWDGQPVRFVCCERKKPKEGGDPWGPVFWCISIEMAEDCGDDE